jgi:hypothetical protein
MPMLDTKPKGGVDIDWDDDDEATTVFDKSQDDPARALLQSSPPAAGAPAPRPAAGMPMPSRSVPPPSLSKPPPPPPAPLSKSLAPPAPTMPTMSRGPLPPPPVTAPVSSMPAPAAVPDLHIPAGMQASGGRGLLYALAAVVILGAAAAGYFLVAGKPGSLVVTVAGPGNKTVNGVEIFVDGEKKNCPVIPCRIPDLKPGTHLVKVAAAGYTPTADKAFTVTAGNEAVENVELARPSEGTGIKVASEGRGLKLLIDGKEIGPLPQEIRDMTPGDHTVRIEGGERYEPFEKTITVEADKLLTLEPKLKVKKGLATIKLGENADGADVTLVSGDERRPIPRFPLAIELETNGAYTLVATKRGFADYEKKIDFEDGEAEKTFVIDLRAEGSAPEDLPAASRGSSGSARSAIAGAVGGGKPAAAAPAAGNAVLTFASTPSSNVILDGRPLGPTPKTATVPAGRHTILFVHPEHGRKAKSVEVKAGQKATLKVSFP